MRKHYRIRKYLIELDCVRFKNFFILNKHNFKMAALKTCTVMQQQQYTEKRSEITLQKLCLRSI